MKKMINLSQESIFINNLRNLHDISYDRNNNAYMTNSEYPAIDFDGVKNSYIFSNSKISASNMRSNDALIVLDYINGKFLFIEFKNGDIHSTHKKEEIRSKIAESLLILNDIIHEDLTFDRNNINYILVYNQSKNPSFQKQRSNSLTRIANTLASWSNTTYLINGFDKYKAFFHDVKTINETEFNVVANQLEKNTLIF